MTGWLIVFALVLERYRFDARLKPADASTVWVRAERWAAGSHGCNEPELGAREFLTRCAVGRRPRTGGHGSRIAQNSRGSGQWSHDRSLGEYLG